MNPPYGTSRLTVPRNGGMRGSGSPVVDRVASTYPMPSVAQAFPPNRTLLLASKPTKRLSPWMKYQTGRLSSTSPVRSPKMKLSME